MTFYVSYNGCGEQSILLTKDAPSADAVITNARKSHKDQGNQDRYRGRQTGS
ncbi:MAG: hypothetical protein ACLUOF_00575 [Ruminococcus sp.]